MAIATRKDALSSLVPNDERGELPRSEVQQQPQLDGLYPTGQMQLTARSVPAHSQAVRPKSSEVSGKAVVPMYAKLPVSHCGCD
jgi:hypothetical protein